MKNKKTVIIFGGLLIVILIGGYLGIKYVKNKNEGIDTAITEYTPEEEITEEGLRKTIVSLYYVSKDTNELTPEARIIDIKEILNTPYEKIINLLMEEPKNNNNKKIIPENTKLLNSYIENDCVTLDFSSEFLNYNKEYKNEKDNLINSLVNTLSQFTEVNKIKILINGNEVEDFNEEYSRRIN